MRFRVFPSKATARGVRSYYFHVVSTNGKITLPSQNYPTASHAHRAVAQVWKSFARALGEVALARARPIPYTKDSLLPVTRKKRTPLVDPTPERGALTAKGRKKLRKPAAKRRT